MKIHNTGKKLRPYEDVPYYLDEEEDPQDVQAFPEALIQETKRAIQDNRNVEVTAPNGIITLNGVVFSQEEKMSIGDKAAAVTGFNKVNNCLEVIER